MEIVAQILSVIGALTVLLAYILISLGKVGGQSVSYHVMNIVASIFLGVSAVIILNVGHLLLNAIVTSIAISMIIKIRRGNEGSTRSTSSSP